MNRFFQILFLLLIGTSLLAAQNADQPLTLSRAVELSRSNNLTLQQQEQRIRQAQSVLASQKTQYYPTLSLNGSFVYVSELARLEMAFPIPGSSPIEIEAGSRDQYDIFASVQQPVFTGFRIRNLVKAAAEEVRQAEIQKQVVQNQIILQVHRIFYQAQLNRLQQQVLQTSLSRAAQQQKTVRNLYRAEQATAFDTLKIANQLLSLRTSLNKLRYREKIILSQLAEVLNLPEIESLQPLAPEDVSPILEAPEAYLAQARQHRPEFRQLDHRLAAQKYRRKSIRAQLFPQIYARASYHYAKPGVNFFRKEWMDYYHIGVNLQWEIWNWGRTRQQMKQASLSTNLIELEEKKLAEKIRQEVSQAYQRLLSDRDQIEMTRRLVAQEEERYRIASRRYQQGLAPLPDVTDAESALTAAQLQLQQSIINYLMDRAQMDYATGRIGAKE